MAVLSEELRSCLRGRSCLVGVGEITRGDDGFGVHLARRLAAEPPLGLTLVEAGLFPERLLGQVSVESFDSILFVDAVDFGAEPGALVILDSDEIVARFAPISTHHVSLGILTRALSSTGLRSSLLGVQPGSLTAGEELTPEVETALEVTLDLLAEISSSSGGPSLDRAGSTHPKARVNEGAR